MRVSIRQSVGSSDSQSWDDMDLSECLPLAIKPSDHQGLNRNVKIKNLESKSNCLGNLTVDTTTDVESPVRNDAALMQAETPKLKPTTKLMGKKPMR
jgi:hypothetical protein